MRQKFRQNNWGARLHLAEEDFLVAAETPRHMHGSMRTVKMRFSRDPDGYAERAVYDSSRYSGGFWHHHLFVPIAKLEELAAILETAKKSLERVTIQEDPQGTYRTICFWHLNQTCLLRMEYAFGEARFSVPEFEDAWLILNQQFPSIVAWEIPLPKA